MKEQLKIGAPTGATMSMETAMQRAAAAWCGEKTKHKVMDPELAMEFARILQKEVNGSLLRERVMRSKLLSTEGVRAAKAYEKLTGESLYKWVELDAKEKANERQLALMNDAMKVYRLTRGTSLPFPPEAITHLEIGEDRRVFNPYAQEDSNGNEATDR